MASSRITSLLEGLQLTPPSSARTKKVDDTRYYVHTYLVRTRSFSKNDFPFDEIYRRLLSFTLGRMYHTLWYQVFVYSFVEYAWYLRSAQETAVSLYVYWLVGGGTHDTYVPPKKQLYRYLFIRAKRVSNWYIPPKKSVRVCVCVRLILILVWKNIVLVFVWGTYYVPATYVPGISRQTTVWYQVRTYNIGLH